MGYFNSLQLEKEPFSTSPDPAFFYQSKDHSAALNRLEIAIRLKRGLSLVLGDVGTGKTTLLRALLQAFYGEEDQYVFHMILDPSFKTENQFLSHLTKLFGISPFFRSTINHREAIEKYLYQKCVEENKTVVLLIDEGQKLDFNQIEILRTLLNYETNDTKMLQLVILAQMELLSRIKPLRNFMDRIAMKFILLPLNEQQTAEMIAFRLKCAGYKEQKFLFSNEAVHLIHQFTQGYPRQIARMCHTAMEYLVMENHECVNLGLIEKIIDQEKVWI